MSTDIESVCRRLQDDIDDAPHAIADRIWLVKEVQRLQNEVRGLELRDKLDAIRVLKPNLTRSEAEAIEWAILQPGSHIEDRDDTLGNLLKRSR